MALKKFLNENTKEAFMAIEIKKRNGDIVEFDK